MTFLEKLQAEHPDVIKEYTDAETGKLQYAFGCPWAFDYADSDSLQCAAQTSCCACWNREIPEEKQAEEPVEIKIEEKKKMRNLRALIESKVEDAIASGKIDEYVENIVEDMDLDGDIDDLIETEIRENIDDYVGPILSETVRDAVRETLDNLFN